MQIEERMQLTGKDCLLAMVENCKKEVGKGRQYGALLAETSPKNLIAFDAIYSELKCILFWFFFTFNLIKDYFAKRKGSK